jgi:hypothetical protein
MGVFCGEYGTGIKTRFTIESSGRESRRECGWIPFQGIGVFYGEYGTGIGGFKE